MRHRRTTIWDTWQRILGAAVRPETTDSEDNHRWEGGCNSSLKLSIKLQKTTAIFTPRSDVWRILGDLKRQLDEPFRWRSASSTSTRRWKLMASDSKIWQARQLADSQKSTSSHSTPQQVTNYLFHNIFPSSTLKSEGSTPKYERVYSKKRWSSWRPWAVRSMLSRIRSWRSGWVIESWMMKQVYRWR